MKKFRLKNTPGHGHVIVEFYDATEGGISDFFGGIFGITDMDNKTYLYRGLVAENSLYKAQIGKLNKDNKQFVKISSE